MRLLIVIVNYRTAGLVIDCLRSLEPEIRAIGAGVRTIVVDGKSPDDSVQQISDAIAANGWADWCDFEPLPVNGGFAYANNAGIKPFLDSADKPDLIYLLNPDTIVRPGAVQTLLSFMDRRPDVAIAGSRTEDPDGTPQCSAFRFHGIASELEMAMRLGPVTKLLRKWMVAPPPRDDEHQVDWVVGASMMIRREVFEQIGLLDDGYFMYFEETDFCLRARRAGFTCWYVPSARIVHLIGQASGVTDAKQQNKRRPAYWFEARRRYFTKNYGRMYAALADLAFIGGFLTWRVRRVLQRKPDPDPQRFLRDFIAQSSIVKGMAKLADLSESEHTRGVGLWTLIKEDYVAHRRDWTRPGFRAMAVYRLGVWRMRIGSKLLRFPVTWLYRRLFIRVRNWYGIEVPFSAKIGRRVVIEHQHGIVIHGASVIGNDCRIRQGVTLGNKDLDAVREAPTLGDRVNVGAGAKILGPIKIGDGAAIGANAVVLKDVPAGAVAVGIPARVIERK